MSDRGMMKWNAFNALLEHGSTVGEMIRNRDKKEKPILSEDKLEEMNASLERAILDGLEVKVSWFLDGRIFQVKGIVQKVDSYQRIITVSDRKLQMDYITEIEIV